MLMETACQDKKANLLPAYHVTTWWSLWMIILGCDKVCWDVCLDGHNLTCAWRGWSTGGSSSPGSNTRSTPLGCSGWASCASVWWTGSGSTLGTCSFCGMRLNRTNDVYDCGGRMTSLPAPKKKSLKMENFKPEKTTHSKLFEGPCRSRCFTKIIASSFTAITASSSFADIIASSSFTKIIASSSFTKIIAKVITSTCSLNRQHLEMPGMPQTSSRTYCLRWDKFQQQWDVFQLMETHAYTFTAGGIYLSDMQRKKGDHHGLAEQTGGSTSRTCSADGGIDFTFTAGGFYFSDIQRKEGEALSRVTAMFATTAVHSFITIKSSQG